MEKIYHLDLNIQPDEIWMTAPTDSLIEKVQQIRHKGDICQQLIQSE